MAARAACGATPRLTSLSRAVPSARRALIEYDAAPGVQTYTLPLSGLTLQTACATR